MRKSTRDSCKAQVTWFLTLAPTQSPFPPCPLRDAGKWRVLWLQSCDKWLSFRNEPHPTPPPPPSQECWMIGRDLGRSALFSFFSPLPLYTGSWSSPANMMELTSFTFCLSPDLEISNRFECLELSSVLRDSGWHTLPLSLPFCSWNNPALTIPLKPIGFTEREWEIGYRHWLKWPIYLFIFSVFIQRAFKSLSQFPAVPARFIHPLLMGASEPPKLCRSVSEQTE